jgi:hypothetical protein
VPALENHLGPWLSGFSGRPRERSSVLFDDPDRDELHPNEAPHRKRDSKKRTSEKRTSEKSTSDVHSSSTYIDAWGGFGVRTGTPNTDLPPPGPFQTASAPLFNLPASTALLSAQRHTPKSDQDRYGEQVVWDLLAFQSFDGSFKVDSLDQLKDLGHEFALTVRKLEFDIHFQVAMSIAIVVLLEEKFQFCRDLWVLMRDKARAYVDQNLPHGPVKDRLYRSTKYALRLVQLPMSKPWAGSGSPIVSQSAHMQPVGWIRGPTDISHPKRKEKPEPEMLDSGSRLTPPVAAVVHGISRKRVALETASVDTEHLPFPSFSEILLGRGHSL